jgi:hypothetical protein
MIVYGLEGGGQSCGPAWEVLGPAGEFIDLVWAALDRDAYVVGLMRDGIPFSPLEQPPMMLWITT